MSADRYSFLTRIANTWMIRIWQERNLENFNDMHHEDFIDHSPAGRGSTREDYLQSIHELYVSFPDFSAQTDDLVVDLQTSKVAIRWTARATHQGDFLGIPASGQPITFQGIEIITIDPQGKIIERWGEWDGLSLITQLTGNRQNI